MNIVEAVRRAKREGKRFKHKDFNQGQWVDLHVCDSCLVITPEHILDDRWEVEEAWYEGNFKEKYFLKIRKGYPIWRRVLF